MKKYLLLFGAILFPILSCSLYGQDTICFRVVDNELNEPIPFVNISNTAGKSIALSDYNGVVKLERWRDMNETIDSLIFISSFFEPLRIATSDIVKFDRKDIILSARVFELAPATIRPLPSPDKIAEEIAKTFYRKFDTRNYVSEGTLVQTVVANGRYCEFMAAKGYYLSLYFTMKQPKPFGKRKFQSGWALYDMLRSDAFSATQDAVLDPAYVYSDSQKTFNIEYDSRPNNLPVDKSRRIAIYYSPLHRSATKHYNYKVDSVYYNQDNCVIIIGFRTKKADFPKECPLYAEGKIVYDYTGKEIQKIELYNFLDYWNNYRRTGVVLPPLHESFLSVSFREFNGLIYIDETVYERKWNKSPDELNHNFYYSSRPTRRNASSVGLVERAWQKASTPHVVNNLDNHTITISENWDYCAYNPKTWDKVDVIGGVKIAGVKTDLGRSKPLMEQAMGNALRTDLDKDHALRMQFLFKLSESIKKQQNETK